MIRYLVLLVADKMNIGPTVGGPRIGPNDDFPGCTILAMVVMKTVMKTYEQQRLKYM